MLQTTKVHIDQNNTNYGILYNLCYHAARMYNVGLYSVRQHFFNTTKYLSYYENYHLCKENENYKLLLTDTGQQILRLVDRDMKSFFHLLKLKQQGKYSEKVRLPRYKDKQGLMTFAVQGRSVRMKNNRIRIGLTKEMRDLYNLNQRYVEFTIPKHLLDVKTFNEVRIVPMYGGKQYSLEYVYDTEQLPKARQAEGNGYLSIDLGVDNLMSCAVFSNGQSRQFIIDGRRIKSVNAYYNKTISKLKAQYSTNKGVEHPNLTKRMLRLYNGRYNRMNQYFDNAVKYIIDICLEYGISTVVVGYNKGQKNGIDIGAVNDQNFVCIPYHKLRQKLCNKCLLHGIRYESQEESYTSKSSCLDCDELPVYGDDVSTVKFSGKRVHRGLYMSSDGSLLNADINGSVNILRKYFKERNENWLYQDSVRALVNVPCKRVNPLFKSTLL